MTPHSDTFQTRLADVEFARWLRELAVRVPRKTLPANRERLDTLADHLHHKVCIDCVSFEEYVRAANAAVQAENPYGETMTDDDKKKIAEEVTKRGATWFSRMMDRFAANPLTKAALVRRFRKWNGGKLSVEEIEKLADVGVKVADKVKRK
jgi:hypothetical protein